MQTANETLRGGVNLSTRVLIHKLGSLAKLDEDDVEIIRATAPARTREIPGGVPLPDQRRSRRSFVVSGWVGRLNLFADGRRQVISTMVSGELVGPHPNPFITQTTVALVSSQLCDLTPLLDALDQNSGGYVQLRRALTLAGQIEEAQLAEQVVRLGRRSAVERLGHWLLDLQHRLGMAGVSQGDRFPMPLTQELLSDVLGMSIVHVNRIIQQLRRERLADVKGGYVTIMEPERLKMITEFVPLPNMDAPPEDAPQACILGGDAMLAAGVQAQDIADLFPMKVSACIATAAMQDAPLFAAEQSVAKARAARRSEFAAGRASARQALAALGGPMVALPVGTGRAPIWPEGFVGSITHTDDFCAAVTARAGDATGLGLDAESAEPLEPAVARLVCRPKDYPSSVEGTDLGDVAWSKVIFSIKEAFYKCQYPLTGRFLDFDAAAVSFAPRQTPLGGGFSISACEQADAPAPWPRCSGRWRIVEGLVLAGVWFERVPWTAPAEG